MTMLSFRIEQEVAAAVDRWCAELGIERSDLLREAVRRHLAIISAEHDAEAWAARPRSTGEMALAESAEWGPAEDWSDWADAQR